MEMENGNPPHSRSVPPADLPKQECGEHTILDGSLYGADSTTTALVVREMQRCMGQVSQTVERGHFARLMFMMVWRVLECPRAPGMRNGLPRHMGKTRRIHRCVHSVKTR